MIYWLTCKHCHMKAIIRLIMFLTLCTGFNTTSAQSSGKGFDYSSHHRMNQRSQRWGEKRLKASNHDQVNLKCSVRQSRKYVRRKKA